MATIYILQTELYQIQIQNVCLFADSFKVNKNISLVASSFTELGRLER
jgi:hypothetical protein